MGGAAHAATLLEAEVAGGEYSANFSSPTVVDAGIDMVRGIGGVASDDYFVFTALAAGAQDIVLSFDAPEGYGYSYSAGGAVLIANSPFRYEWDGQQVGAGFQIDHGKPSQTMTLSLDGAFSGSLYLALNFTHGADLRYALFAPTNSFGEGSASGPAQGASGSPSQVPLPPALLFLASSVVGLLVVRRKRRV